MGKKFKMEKKDRSGEQTPKNSASNQKKERKRRKTQKIKISHLIMERNKQPSGQSVGLRVMGVVIYKVLN